MENQKKLTATQRNLWYIDKGKELLCQQQGWVNMVFQTLGMHDTQQFWSHYSDLEGLFKQ